MPGLSPALFSGVGKQLQAGADAHAVRPDLRAGLDRFRRRRHAHAGMAARRQRDGRDSGAGGRRRAADPDRADPAASSPSNTAGSAARPSREKFELLRWLFWDNHKLTGYMATYRFMRTFTPSADPQVLKHFRRRLDDFLSILETAPAAERVRDRRAADGGRYFDDGLSALSGRRDRIRFCGEPSRHAAPGSDAWRNCRAGNRPMICCRANA